MHRRNEAGILVDKTSLSRPTVSKLRQLGFRVPRLRSGQSVFIGLPTGHYVISEDDTRNNTSTRYIVAPDGDTVVAVVKVNQHESRLVRLLAV